MPIIRSLWHRVYIAIATLSWGVLAGFFLVHALLSYLAFVAAGEKDLTDHAITFAYFYTTTATTVGYGDLSPKSDGGRLANVLLVLPGSIALFTAFLGKAIADIGAIWRRRLQGLGDFSEDRSGHTLVVGWQGTRTRRLIEGLLHDSGGSPIVLLATGIAENPMPADIDFIASDGLSHPEFYVRAAAGKAATVVIRGRDDDETMAATLAAHAAAPDAHIVAHFGDEGAARLIRTQFPDEIGRAHV